MDLFLKVGKWVLNCAAGDKLVVRWFIDGIVSAHVLQIRCYRGTRLESVLKSMKKVPGCFLDRCKNWTRDLYGHNLDILLGLQSLNQPIWAESWSLSELTDALCHWIERKRSRIWHWIYFRYLKTVIYTDLNKKTITVNRYVRVNSPENYSETIDRIGILENGLNWML